jgi:hypothetical protein
VESTQPTANPIVIGVIVQAVCASTRCAESVPLGTAWSRVVVGVRRELRLAT